jgi:hypothetical protein
MSSFSSFVIESSAVVDGGVGSFKGASGVRDFEVMRAVESPSIVPGEPTPRARKRGRLRVLIPGDPVNLTRVMPP